MALLWAFQKGSPPRVRGKVDGDSRGVVLNGITPACAGKRRGRGRERERRQDHPRVCGEKPFRSNHSTTSEGSPPHVRGKGGLRAAVGILAGITPACAGKSFSGTLVSPVSLDHPRVCGEKVGFVFQLACPLGSPPHVRGKETLYMSTLENHRITPACAGKSIFGELPPFSTKDHPRVCGEKL